MIVNRRKALAAVLSYPWREWLGVRPAVAGQVLGRDCKPIANALLDFWHADENGEYDNGGFRFRGHQITDSDGRYRLETIVPALYPGRARHIHVKVQAPGEGAFDFVVA